MRFKLVLCSVAAAAVLHAADFVYSNNNTSPNTISGFSVDAAGALTTIPGSPFKTGGDAGPGNASANRIAAVSVGGRLYAANSSSNTVSGFTIDPNTGGLAPVPGSPFRTGLPMGSSASVAASPNGKFLAVGHSGGPIVMFAIDAATGSLQPVPGSPLNSGATPYGITISPDSRFLAVTQAAAGASRIVMFNIDSQTGSLSPVPGSPFSAKGPSSAEINCAGNRLVAGTALGVVQLFDLSESGNLTLLASPPSYNPQSVSLSQKDDYVFTNGGTYVDVLQVGAGTLLPIVGSPYPNPAPWYGSGMAIRRDGKFLYVPGRGTINVFGVAANGALTLLGSSAVAGATVVLAAYPPKSCDITPPTTTATQSPAANENGWNNTSVTISLSAVDNPDGSGVNRIQYSLSGAQSGSQTVSGGSASMLLSAEGITTLSYYAVDNAGNQEATKTLVVRIDKTPPDITLAQRTASNAAGWNNTAVNITWSCADGGSGTVSASVSQSVAAEGQNQSATGTCRDLAGNTASNTQTGISIDFTPPGVTFGAGSPAPNTAGWNNTNVAVPFTAFDNLSGLAAGNPTSPLAITPEGTGLKGTLTLTDVAGNSATYTTPASFNIDKTLPAITGMPPANCLLWPPNHQLVKVADVRASDGLSLLAGLSVTAASSEPDDGLGDGDTPFDVVLQGGVVELRAERSPLGGGRTYTIRAVATDLAGNSKTLTSVCTVPVNRGN